LENPHIYGFCSTRRGNSENEISETYVGRIRSGSELKPSDPMWKDGRFLSVEEIKQLIIQKKTTPHLAMSLELYIKNNIKSL
jgi:hypothetical protein